MRLIINATTLSGTGVTQVAVSFIHECVGFAENEYHVFLSKSVSTQIVTDDFPNNFSFYEFDGHPLYGIKGFHIRNRLDELEAEIKPDFIFTVFGPSCWTPKKTKHLSGFANSYYVFPDSPFFKIIPLKDKIRINILKMAHRFFLKRNGKYFVCETEAMNKGLVNFLKIPKQNVFTVSNTFSAFFEDENISNNKPLLKERELNEFRFLFLASFDVHKNQTILNQVIPLFENRIGNSNVKFVLTIKEDLFLMKFSDVARSKIINIGRVDAKDCPALYKECDAVFLPTLIESFSANFPEAMKMNRPIMTSHYPFAKSICGPAAYYFDPLDPNDIVEKIAHFIDNWELREDLVKQGQLRLAFFGNAKERTKKYLNIIKGLI